MLTLALGVTASSAFRMEREATIKPGGTITLAGYTVRLNEMWGREEPQRVVVGASLFVERGGKRIGTLDPRLNYFRTSEQPVATPAVRSRADADLYVNLMAFERDGSSATFRVLVEPLVAWIWAGGMIVALGALVCVWPGAAAPAWVPAGMRRARAEAVEEEEPAVATEGAA